MSVAYTIQMRAGFGPVLLGLKQKSLFLFVLHFLY